jgi:Uma2 family endonuclease
MRLTREEFRQRWERHPEVAHAERIEGVVVMPAAKRHVEHGRPHRALEAWLSRYEYSTEGVEGSLAASVAIDEENDPEPDSILFVRADCGGRCRITGDGYLEGSPELVGEVSGSTASTDLGRKREIYERNGVGEYLVWLTAASEIRWFRLREAGFQPLVADAQGIVRSEVFPGLWLDVSAMLRGDMQRVLEVLNEGLASPEHASFVQSLRERGGKD